MTNPWYDETVRSLVVDAENDSRAEKGVVLVCVTRVVVVCVVPQTLRSDADSLTSHLTNNALNNDFVAGNMALIFYLGSDCVNDLFRPVLCMGMLIFLFAEHAFDNRLNNCFDF